MKRLEFLKILVPVDGSEYSVKALLQACELAKIHKSKIFVIYVIEKSIPINLLDRNEYLGILKKFGKKTLEKSNKTCLNKGVDPKLVLKEGNVVDEITKYAKKEKCNLIVIGQKGLGKTLRFFLGSVSNKLANKSPCSVLIVK